MKGGIAHRLARVCHNKGAELGMAAQLRHRRRLQNPGERQRLRVADPLRISAEPVDLEHPEG